jgi:PHD/YefM family antitoxin component YafN of YafNO toxin-antitoxin module
MEQNFNLNFLDYLISISDFSKGKTAKVFQNVIDNGAEYIVLKNNQPKAILLSIDTYKQMQEDASRYKTIISALEQYKKGDEEPLHTFESINKDLGVTIKELNYIMKKTHQKKQET